jgi:hypothetical protein
MPPPLPRRAAIAAAALLLAAPMSPLARAAPVVWDPGAGGNGNSYDVILDNNLSWDAARAAAQSRGGDLVTIDSQAEQSFVESLLSAGNAATGSYWLGLRETATEGVYHDVNGQALGYTHWAVGEPNNSQGIENSGAVLWTTGAADAAALARRGLWNEEPASGYPLPSISVPPDVTRGGYLLEIAAPDGGGPGTGNDGGGTAVPLPAAVFAFPPAAAFAGIFYRRMRRAG